MGKEPKRRRIPAVFYCTATGTEPVREWLRRLSAMDRKTIGTDIATIQFGWPVGMPVCRKITGRKGLFEVRSDISDGRIARVLFCFHQSQIVLLHGFIKKSQETPVDDLDLAMRRKKEIER